MSESGIHFSGASEGLASHTAWGQKGIGRHRGETRAGWEKGQAPGPEPSRLRKRDRVAISCDNSEDTATHSGLRTGETAQCDFEHGLRSKDAVKLTRNRL